MRHKIDVLYHNLRDISKDTLTLMIGTLVANLVPLCLQPFLKRVYTPEEFGNLEVYLRIFNILVAISSLKYENAIFISKRSNDTKHILVLSILISILVFMCIILVLIIFGSKISLSIQGLSLVSLWILPFAVVSYSIFNACNLYLIKSKRFFLSATNKVVRRIFEGVTQTSLGFLNWNSGLLIGDFAGNVVQGAYALSKTKKLVGTRVVISLRKLKVLASEFQELPKYTLVPNVLNTFVLGSLTFLIIDKYSMTEVGYLEFTQKILAIPSVFLSVAISQIVFQRVSELVNKKEKIVPFIVSIIFLLFAISLVFFIVIQFYSHEIYTLIGGENWIASGEYAKILVFSSCATLIFSPLGKVLIVLKKFKINSAWEIGKFLIILCLFFVTDFLINDFIRIYALIHIIFYVAYGIIILYQSIYYQNNLLETNLQK